MTTAPLWPFLHLTLGYSNDKRVTMFLSLTNNELMDESALVLPLNYSHLLIITTD